MYTDQQGQQEQIITGHKHKSGVLRVLIP
uniref:Uncharacterized protein n=1 Tax=Anguilla anguilla TaxID=7936 RepID=A0A0E9WFY7_ANGAN